MRIGLLWQYETQHTQKKHNNIIAWQFWMVVVVLCVIWVLVDHIHSNERHFSSKASLPPSHLRCIHTTLYFFHVNTQNTGRWIIIIKKKTDWLPHCVKLWSIVRMDWVVNETGRTEWTEREKNHWIKHHTTCLAMESMQWILYGFICMQCNEKQKKEILSKNPSASIGTRRWTRKTFEATTTKAIC